MSSISTYMYGNCFQKTSRIPVFGCAIAMKWQLSPTIARTNASLIAADRGCQVCALYMVWIYLLGSGSEHIA